MAPCSSRIGNHVSYMTKIPNDIEPALECTEATILRAKVSS